MSWPVGQDCYFAASQKLQAKVSTTIPFGIILPIWELIVLKRLFPIRERIVALLLTKPVKPMKREYMRVIAIRTLREFWIRYPTAKMGLELWYEQITSRKWLNPNEIVNHFPGADIVGNNRIVFNIHGNDYRLIVTFRYAIQQCFIRFIDTHKEYDKIQDISNV